MTKKDESPFAEAMRRDVLEGRLPEMYDGQRAQFQAEAEAEEEEKKAAAARAEADLQRRVDKEVERLKSEGKW